MTKDELYEENAALRQALIELRELVDDALASYMPDEAIEEEIDLDSNEPLHEDAEE